MTGRHVVVGDAQRLARRLADNLDDLSTDDLRLLIHTLMTVCDVASVEVMERTGELW